MHFELLISFLPLHQYKTQRLKFLYFNSLKLAYILMIEFNYNVREVIYRGGISQ